MGYSKAQKEKTHKRIVAIASKRLREKGLVGFGIAELMKEVGLTVGGFYKHFESRDELVAEALSDAFGTWQCQKEAAASGGQPLSFDKLIDDYGKGTRTCVNIGAEKRALVSTNGVVPSWSANWR